MNEGPDLFGSVLSFDVDARGRIYVLDDHAQEVRVFDAGGAFVRTVGGKGEGPGEFVQAGAVDIARNGEIWVMGMSLGRVSIFDSAGTYLRGERTDAGGRIIKPYPGGFDPMGRYNVVTPPAATRGMARFDQSFNPIDIIPLPEDPVEGEYFERLNEDGVATMSVSVPFQGFMTWRFSPTGTVWMLLTGRYELIETTTGGEVLRRVTKEHEPIPVTAEERERAIEDLDWFTSQGGGDRPLEDPRLQTLDGVLLHRRRGQPLGRTAGRGGRRGRRGAHLRPVRRRGPFPGNGAAAVLAGVVATGADRAGGGDLGGDEGRGGGGVRGAGEGGEGVVFPLAPEPRRPTRTSSHSGGPSTVLAPWATDLAPNHRPAPTGQDRRQ